MPDPITGLIVGGSTLIGGAIQGNAATTAANIQSGAAEKGLEEQKRQFDAATALLKPYVDAGIPGLEGLIPYSEAGASSLQAQLALAGLSGVDAQRKAIGAIEQGAEYQSLVGAGEEAILQSAAATGGVRGGNVQGALSEFRPQVLSSLINQQYSRLGGLANMGATATQNIASMGQAAAAGQAAQATAFGQNVTQGYENIGAAQAGGVLGKGKAYGDVFGGIGQMTGYMAGKGVTF